MHEVELTRRAYREFNKLSLADQDRIEAELDRLSANPRPAGTRKIRGNIYRIRIGDWRIIYAVFDKDRLVLVGGIIRRAEDSYDGVEGRF
ncbi:MAG: type II toxin-antitoxin system RelE/ParE family toxin [Chloroflexi bacterium]|nr:type II toxin-antitoxin system RelE/ParE family toxin [Chloroflexota bacterium]